MATKNKVSILKIRRVLEKSGLSNEAKRSLYSSLVPNAPENVQLSREHMTRIVETLRRDGKCGITLSANGRLQVISGEKVKFTHYHFENPEIQKKAMEARFGKPETNDNLFGVGQL